MKINMPVTDHEVEMIKGTILVSRTNQKGIITFVNDAFVDISGFTRDELIGKNHNIIRHPDMPAAAFEDLWMCNKAVNPWTGLVKNRCKNGDYYWVEACVTPVFENGKVSEFLSVRYKPNREQIAKAEGFYQKLNANQVQMRPTGLNLMMKKIKEFNFLYKGVTALTALLLPAAYLMYQFYLDRDYPFLAIVACLALFSIFLAFKMYRLVENTLESTIGVCYAMAGGYYRNKIDLDRGDVIGDFHRAVFSTQVKLNADMAYVKEEGIKSSRIKQALDQVTGNVMMADVNHDIMYMNKSAIELFFNNEDDFKKDLPDFDSTRLIGTNIDTFHKNPAHQRSLLDDLTQTMQADLLIGGHNMVIIASPVYDGEVRLGTVVEWIDKTQEVSIQKEIDSIVNKVSNGQLDSRIELTGKEGFFAQLSEGINELTDVVEHVINEIAYVMSGVAEGDLTRTITKEYHGTFADCKEDINKSLHKLSSVFTDVLSSAEFINNSSDEIASGNNNLSQRAEQQAASLEETASSMEQLTSTVKNNADNADQANQVATTARQLAENGGAVVSSAVEAMQEINESSNKIAEIIGVIDEIAFQTNLLALNASVEAARAGEQGRGFSVVATEVRNLAQRSATAAKESKELIQSSVQKVRSGTEFVNETGKALTEIVTGVKKVGDIVAEIAAASAEQSQGIEQVNQAITQMDEITQQNAALAEEASAASISMSDQSTNMTQLLAFFKVAAGGTNVVSKSHVAIKQAVVQPISGEPESGIQLSSKPEFVEHNEVSSTTDNDDEWEDF